MSAPVISCPMGLIIVELWSNYLGKLRKPVKTFGPVPSGFVPFCQSVRSRDLRMWRKPTIKVYQDILFITFSTRPHLYWKPWKSPKRLGRFTTIGQRKVASQVHTMWDSKQADVHKGGNCTEKAYTSFKTRFPQFYRCDVLCNRKKIYCQSCISTVIFKYAQFIFIIRWSGRDTDHSHPSSAEVKNE
jgi:hypothetical protein